MSLGLRKGEGRSDEPSVLEAISVRRRLLDVGDEGSGAKSSSEELSAWSFEGVAALAFGLDLNLGLGAGFTMRLVPFATSGSSLCSAAILSALMSFSFSFSIFRLFSAAAGFLLTTLPLVPGVAT